MDKIRENIPKIVANCEQEDLVAKIIKNLDYAESQKLIKDVKECTERAVLTKIQMQIRDYIIKKDVQKYQEYDCFDDMNTKVNDLTVQELKLRIEMFLIEDKADDGFELIERVDNTMENKIKRLEEKIEKVKNKKRKNKKVDRKSSSEDSEDELDADEDLSRMGIRGRDIYTVRIHPFLKNSFNIKTSRVKKLSDINIYGLISLLSLFIRETTKGFVTQKNKEVVVIYLAVIEVLSKNLELERFTLKSLNEYAIYLISEIDKTLYEKRDYELTITDVKNLSVNVGAQRLVVSTEKSFSTERSSFKSADKVCGFYNSQQGCKKTASECQFKHICRICYDMKRGAKKHSSHSNECPDNQENSKN